MAVSPPAAAVVERSGKAAQRRAAIVAALTRRPHSTYREIAAMAQLEPVEAGRRLNDLERQDRVAKGIIRVCTLCGNRCLTWHVTAAVSPETS